MVIEKDASINRGSIIFCRVNQAETEMLEVVECFFSSEENERGRTLTRRWREGRIMVSTICHFDGGKKLSLERIARIFYVPEFVAIWIKYLLTVRNVCRYYCF